jgi:hypothetical protein
VDENQLSGEPVRFITAAARATRREKLRLVDGLDLTGCRSDGSGGVMPR